MVQVWTLFLVIICIFSAGGQQVTSRLRPSISVELPMPTCVHVTPPLTPPVATSPHTTIGFPTPESDNLGVRIGEMMQDFIGRAFAATTDPNAPVEPANEPIKEPITVPEIHVEIKEADTTEPKVVTAPSKEPEPHKSTKPGPKPKQPDTKYKFNFASKECGAKVLGWNMGAVGTSSILSGSKDIYMMYECSNPDQFVEIELCDDTGIDHFSLANYEFFSSTFKDIVLMGSEHYPTRQWSLIGRYHANNTKELQRFSTIQPDGKVAWFKYLRLNILSHWGNEFYCPISQIKVHGVPVIEKLIQSSSKSS